MVYLSVGLNACPDLEGIKTGRLHSRPCTRGLNACPDLEGIKTHRHTDTQTQERGLNACPDLEGIKTTER